ncbi:MAG: ABC transporter substrate-binding protein [Calditrichaceae bacterium]
MKNVIGFSLVLIFILSCNIFFKENTVREAIRQFPNGLDPASNLNVDEVQIYSQIYESLFRISEVGNNIIPNLAKQIVIAPNNDSFIIQLRSNVYFHDGKLLCSGDVKASFEWQTQKYPKSSVFEMVDSIQILDSLQLRIILKYPYSSFPYLLASPFGLAIMSQDAIKKYGQSIKFNPVGTGPFRLVKWEPGKQIELCSYSYYWQKKNNLDAIIFKHYSDKYEREESILSDETDILYVISGYSVDRLRWLGKINYQIIPASSVFFVGFNNDSRPFHDRRVRKAVLKAINLPKLVLNVNRGNAMVANNPLPPIYLQDSKLMQDNYDIQTAKQLMKDAGYEDGLTLNFYFPKVAYYRNTIIEILKSELSKIGIILKFQEYNSWEEHTKAVKSDSSQIFIYGGKNEIIGDAESFLRSFFHSKSEFNTLHYQNARVDEWLDQARLESDPGRRQELYKKITEQILADTPAVFLYHVKPHFAYNREKIKTLPVNPYGIIQYHKIELNN